MGLFPDQVGRLVTVELKVGMKIWKNNKRLSYYIIEGLDKTTVTLRVPGEAPFTCDRPTVVLHVLEFGLVNTWVIKYFNPN